MPNFLYIYIYVYKANKLLPLLLFVESENSVWILAPHIVWMIDCVLCFYDL